MKLHEAEIERIVREVLGRLGQAAPRATANGEPEGTANSATLVLDQPLVTQADLAERLTNQQSIAVRPRSVVTPAARDYLSERNVTIVRHDPSRQPVAVGLRLLVAVEEAGFDASSLIRSLTDRGIAVERMGAADLVSAVDAVAGRVVQDNQPGLIVSPHPVAAVCLANRKTGVRAASAACREDVERAIREIGVNVLVINWQGQSSFSIQNMAGRFCMGAPHPCPEAWRPRFQ